MTDKDKSGRLSRRQFIGGIAGLAGLGLIGTGAYWLPKTGLFRAAKSNVRALSGDLDAQYVRQIITTDPATSRRIMWETMNDLKSPAVEYRPAGAGDAAIRQVAAADETFTDDDHTSHQYGAMLDDLTPGTSYEYRVRSDKAASDWHALNTPARDTDTFRALIFPDSQSNDYSDWENMAQAAWQSHGADLFINMGDLVDNGEDRSQWQAWFDAVHGMIDTIPFAPIMGNHETYNRQWKVRLPEAYLNYFDVPANHSPQFERYYYSFDYGNVHFIVLNSQWEETDEFKSGLRDEQIPWLRQDVANTDKKWKVVLIHRDVLQYRIHNRPERKEGISDIGELFMPLFDELGIDIVFTAHLHTYRDRGHLYNLHPSPDGRGPLYILTGVAGNVRYPGLWIDHAYDKYVAPQPETDNYLTLDASPDTLTVRCYLPDGQQLDEAVVRK